MFSFNRWYLPIWAYSSIGSDDDEEATVLPAGEKRGFNSPTKQWLHQAKHQLLVPILGLLLLATAFALGALCALQYGDGTKRTAFNSRPVSSSPSSSSTPSTSSWPNTPVPEFSTQHQPVVLKPEFTAPPEENSVPNAWLASMPPALFVYIEEPEMYGLDPGMPSDNGTETKAYGVTWTHEYHCLMMVRDEFWSLVRGTSNLAHQYGAEDTLDSDAQRNLWHLAHCMDYIRQLILCQADMTIEVAAKYPATNGKKYHIDGYGTKHVCKNKDELYTWMDSHSPEKYRGQTD